MWGPTIVGYGEYNTVYDSGRKVSCCRTGFSPRKARHSLYISCSCNGEELASPFFKAIREAQPLSHNTLLPCPIIDHPDTLWDLIQEHGARPTHEGAEKMFTTLAPQIREYGEKVRQKMDDAWDNEGYHVWAPAWARMCGFPPERLKARRREFEKSRGREP